VIGSIFAGRYIFFALFALVLSFTLVEFYRLCQLKKIHPQPFTGITVSLILYASIFLYGQNSISGKVMLLSGFLLFLIPLFELFRKKPTPAQNIAFTFTGIVLIALPYSVFNLILIPYLNEPGLYKPTILIGLMVIIWANDSGAYIFGSLFGKHKLAEKISPNKTWEGAIGGAIFATVIALVYFSFFQFFTLQQVIAFSLPTVVAGTFGDLTESLIKRNFKVKDSGNLLPGHGGLFDRFDSLLFAAPVYYLFVIVFLN
jgi:phosphatidate cytidylyltransferase